LVVFFILEGRNQNPILIALCTFWNLVFSLK